jgi:hypothetical protein
MQVLMLVFLTIQVYLRSVRMKLLILFFLTIKSSYLKSAFETIIVAFSD